MARRRRGGTPQARSPRLRSHLVALVQRRRAAGAWVDYDERGMGLGYLPDPVIAERIGRSVLAVAQARRRRGIWAYPWHPRAREDARRLRDALAAGLEVAEPYPVAPRYWREQRALALQ